MFTFTVDCLDPTCTGHGACVNGQCWCKTGWRGVNCSEADNRLSRCFPDCNKHGVYDLETEKCICFDHWAGPDCSRGEFFYLCILRNVTKTPNSRLSYRFIYPSKEVASLFKRQIHWF